MSRFSEKLLGLNFAFLNVHVHEVIDFHVLHMRSDGINFHG